MGAISASSRRRALLAAALAAGAAGLATLARPARATPAALVDATQRIAGTAPLRRGRVRLDVPPLIDNGNAVALTVTVQSPMTAADHVRAIHVLTEKNPQPNVFSVFLGPRAGRAAFTTRVRLADTQTVVAIAQMSDGSFWTDRADVIVTLAACLEELPS
jgi:sulfur-oxidizing protein SoxY